MWLWRLVVPPEVVRASFQQMHTPLASKTCNKNETKAGAFSLLRQLLLMIPVLVVFICCEPKLINILTQTLDEVY